MADQYAQDLAQEESNSITIPLAQYYAGSMQYAAALDTLDHGSDYMRADEEVWQQMFDVYESILDPVGNFTGVQLLEDDSYVQRMVAGYEKLQQVNADQLDEVNLTPANLAFLNKLLAVSELDPYDISAALNIFSEMGLDTASAPDVNQDNAPDYAEVLEGRVTWNGDGSFTAEEDSLVAFNTVLVNEGNYQLTVQAGDLAGCDRGADRRQPDRARPGHRREHDRARAVGRRRRQSGRGACRSGHDGRPHHLYAHKITFAAAGCALPPVFLRLTEKSYMKFP